MLNVNTAAMMGTGSRFSAALTLGPTSGLPFPSPDDVPRQLQLGSVPPMIGGINLCAVFTPSLYIWTSPLSSGHSAGRKSGGGGDLKVRV